jgi:AcrR family transcriptional regulator
MAYRRTDKMVRRLAARHDAILAAARALAAEGGMAAVQIAAVAERAGIAAGTMYRYFPCKTEMVAALVAAVSEAELAAVRRAADAAPGPLSALAATIATFAARALARRRLTWAALAEPVDPEVDAVRLAYRKALAGEIEARVRACLAERHLPAQDAALAAPALLGALIEGLVGPLAPPPPADAAKARQVAQGATLLALRSLGVVDAHARGLVVQTVLPVTEAAAGSVSDPMPAA